MTEITREPYPEQPVAPDSVTRYSELLNLYAHNFQNLDPIAQRGRSGVAEPDPSLLCSDKVEVWNWREGAPDYRATDAARLAVFEAQALAKIDLIKSRIESARELFTYHEAHRDEIEAYRAEYQAWREACDAIDRAYRDAVFEAQRDKARARYQVGTRVRPYRARNGWEIIARTGKGAVIRELRYDDKPARIREVADVLEVD
jgi:hypothetical protein